MTSFDISSSEVSVNRYSQSGACALKASGVTNSYKNETGYAPNTEVYSSPQTVALTSVTNVAPIDDLISDFDVADGERYEKINSLDELEDGGRYLLIAHRTAALKEPGIMFPESIEQTGRIGFKAELNYAFDGSNVAGDYSAKEWTFTKSGDGWKIGAGGKYAKLARQDNNAATATMETDGDVFVVSEANGYYNFSNGVHVLNYNGSRPLVNGYVNSPSNFYIYRLAPSILSVDHYESVKSVNELKDGEKYLLIVKNYWDDNDRYIMLPEVKEKQSRKGFDMESTKEFGDNKVEGKYREKEWTFVKSVNGWKIGNGEQFAQGIGAGGSDGETTVDFENNGDVFAINGTQGSYTFDASNYVLNWN